MQRNNTGESRAGSPGALAPVNGSTTAANGYLPTLVPGNYTNQPTMPGVAPPEKAWPTLTELVNALRRRLVLATFLGVLVGVAAASAVWLALPAGKHKVRALVQVKPLTDVSGRPVVDNLDDYKKTVQALVRTRNVLNMVAQDPAVSRLPLIQTSDDPPAYIDELLKVDWNFAPDIMTISMSGDDYQSMRVLVDSVAKNFVAAITSDDLRETNAQLKRMEDVSRSLEERITAIQAKMKRMTDADGVGGNKEDTTELLKAANEALINIDKEIMAEDKTIRELKIRLGQHKLNVEALDTLPLDAADLDEATKSDPVVQEKMGIVKAAEKRYAALIGSMSVDSAPAARAMAEVRKAEADLRATQESLRPQVEKAARQLKKRQVNASIVGDSEALRMREQVLEVLNGVRRTAEAKITALRKGGHNVRIENDELMPLQDQKAAIAKQLISARMQVKQEGRIFVKEEATATLNQNLRQKVLVALGAFAGGTLLVLAAVGFLEWRSRRVDSVDQVITELGMRVIGTIPAFPSKQSLKSGDASQSQNWRFVLNESVNSARTMLLHTAKSQNMQVLMVTSAMQGEGKTSLASQLATSMATAGLRTLILDCDLRNPSMHKLFDAALTPGCSEVLCQEVDVSDAVQPTSVPNLWLIPAGQCSNKVISALAQGHPLETLFNRLRGQFDFIVVDSCPVLPVADTLLVGQHVDGVVLSILQDISQLPKVQITAERLTQLNIPLLGTVVNGIKPDVHAYGYNYVKQLPA
jgi:capsular exopolysaccharide synthesis family protein